MRRECVRTCAWCTCMGHGWGGGRQSEIRSPGGLPLKTCYSSEVKQMRDKPHILGEGVLGRKEASAR